MIKRPLSKHYPYLLPLIQQVKMRRKSLQYLRKAYRLEKSEENKKFSVYKSQSLLRRTLGSSDPALQEAKIHNLKIAIPHVNNLVINPGQIFSLWRAVGSPEYNKGYVDGMLLSEGKVVTGVGGGLCQLANIIHWLFLHTGMEVKEHWHHEYDVFPDSGRAIPFGSGAGVLYNYFDLQYINNTDETYTLNVYLTDKHLKGEIWSNREQKIKYSIDEKDHRFYKLDDEIFRENKLYKLSIDKDTGNVVSNELIKHNNSKGIISSECRVKLA